MPSATRRAREKSEVHARIIDAARELFIRQGYEEVSMRKIAQAIEYTPAALYVHFKDKTELMKAMCRQDFSQLTRETLKLATQSDPVLRIMMMGEAYIRFGIRHKNQYRLMFMTPHPAEITPTEEDLKRAADPDQDGYAFLRLTVREAIAQGRLRDDCGDAEMVTQTFWSAVHGVVALEITHADDPWLTWRPLKKRISHMLATTMRGMLRDPRELDQLMKQRRGTR